MGLDTSTPDSSTVVIDRTPRELETREQTTRTETYKPPSLLPEPQERPGWVHRWVCTTVSGVSTPEIVSYRMNEGFIPVASKDYPELAMLANKKGQIETGGLLLCRMSQELSRSRDNHFLDKAASSMRAVDTDLATQQDARMPQFKERSSRVSFGKI